MTAFFSSLFYFAALFSAVYWVYFSIRSRRENDVRRAARAKAHTNIGMGIMLISIASVQLFLFVNHWVRFTVGTVFLLIGLFNVFAGIRNYVYFSRKPE